MNSLIHWLFETEAVKVCPGDSPFWYTSGTIGPYYINTHFLYGSESAANNLLSLIDEALGDHISCPGKISRAVDLQYRENTIFQSVINLFCDYIKKNIPLDGIGYISGGERRDWYFSIPVAQKLGLPHISIFKDNSAVLTVDGVTTPCFDLGGAKVLHIADLITEASSYERAWVPAIKAIGGQITHSVVVVDRKQGGGELLQSLRVCSHALASIDLSLFDEALAAGRIDAAQYEIMKAFLENPKEAMRSFILEHPEFMKKALSGPEKTASRARLCLEKDHYGVADLYR